MLDDNKYVVIEDEFGNEVPVLFPPSLTHMDIGRRQSCLSAGFYRVVDGTVIVFGESTTLKLKPRDIDAMFISRLVGGKNHVR